MVVRLLVALLACAALTSGVADAAAPPPASGVAVTLRLDRPAEDVARELDLARDLGAGMVRLDLHWADFEPEPGRYAAWYVGLVDDLVAGARARGLRVLLQPTFSPCWASTAPPDVLGTCATDGRAGAWAPADPAAYGRFAGWLAARYRADLAGIELWNEPNHPGFLQAPDPAAAYVALARAAHAEVQARAPEVPVVAGSLSGSDTAFLARLYALGLRGTADVLSVHAYSEDRAPDAPVAQEHAAAAFLHGLRALRAAMLAAGDATPVWITEAGWTTSAWRDRVPGYLNGVDETTQAAHLRRALELLTDPAAGLGWVRAAVVFQLRDAGTDPWDLPAGYGLVRADLTRKPAFAAVQDVFGAWRAPALRPVGTGVGGRGPAVRTPVAAPTAPAAGLGSTPARASTREVSARGRRRARAPRACAGSARRSGAGRRPARRPAPRAARCRPRR